VETSKIEFDGHTYALPQGKHTARNLRAFLGVPSDHDLWWQGSEEDSGAVRVDDTDAELTLDARERFYSAPMSRRNAG
jgi:hypothetical protein